jgi:hypothetical protein
MKSSKAIFTAAILLVTLFVPHDLSAQRGKALVRGLKWMGNIALTAAVTEVTAYKVRQYFEETPNEHSPISVTINNNYNQTVQFQITTDGYNWYNLALYPNYYQQVQSNYQGAVVIYKGGRYFLVSETGSYNLSRF